MKFLAWMMVLWGGIAPLSAVEVAKGGTIPFYKPYELGVMMYFLPYNPKVVIAGDRVAHLAADIARTIERSAVFCFTSEGSDWDLLRRYQESLPNLYPHYGMLHAHSEDFYSYFSILPHEHPYEDFFRFPGSLLRPIDKRFPFLFGEEYSLPTISLSDFCKRENLSRVHLISLNCGGNELYVLQSSPEIVKNAIAVQVKTYHQPVRQGLPTFEQLNQFMVGCDFELMTHYIYDNVIGDALYVKRKYLSAVFRSKEL